MLPELLSHTSNRFCLTATKILNIHFLSCKTDLVLQSSCEISAFERHAVSQFLRILFKILLLLLYAHACPILVVFLYVRITYIQYCKGVRSWYLSHQSLKYFLKKIKVCRRIFPPLLIIISLCISNIILKWKG